MSTPSQSQELSREDTALASLADKIELCPSSITYNDQRIKDVLARLAGPEPEPEKEKEHQQLVDRKSNGILEKLGYSHEMTTLALRNLDETIRKLESLI
jgi:hypothetical protein